MACEWCKSEETGETYEIQDSGLPMAIYNGNILGVFEEDSDETVSHVEISYCPNCGEELF